MSEIHVITGMRSRHIFSFLQPTISIIRIAPIAVSMKLKQTHASKDYVYLHVMAPPHYPTYLSVFIQVS